MSLSSLPCAVVGPEMPEGQTPSCLGAKYPAEAHTATINFSPILLNGWGVSFSDIIRQSKLISCLRICHWSFLNVRKEAMEVKVTSVVRQFAAIPSWRPTRFRIMPLTLYVIFITPQIKFAFGVYTPCGLKYYRFWVSKMCSCLLNQNNFLHYQNIEQFVMYSHVMSRTDILSN